MINEVLVAPLGEGLVLARAHERAMHILNATAAEMWRVYHDGIGASGEEALFQHLQNLYGLDEGTSRDQAQLLVTAWRQAGLVHEGRQTLFFPPDDDDWLVGSPPSSPLRAGQIALSLPGCRIALEIENRDLRLAVQPVVEQMIDHGTGPCSHLIELRGDSDRWFFSLNGETTTCGASSDEAVVVILNALIDIACRSEDRLLVVHGAGVIGPNGKVALLVAPSGSGKTTLAAGLNAQGFGLLNDDVLPVDLNGQLHGLPTPICLKAGSWRIVADRRADIEEAPTLQRYNEPVRFVPPMGERPTIPLAPSLLLFPLYKRDAEPRCDALPAEVALQKLIEARSIVRKFTQSRLEALAHWVGSAPAYALVYPDLDSGVALVRELMQGLQS